MTGLERSLAMARLRAAECRHSGDRCGETRWTEEAENYELRLRLRDNPWDELAGHPDHTGHCHG